LPAPQAGNGYLRLEIRDHRQADSAVVAALDARLPVVALANAADPTPPVGMTVLFAADADWFNVFAALAERAALIALFAAEHTRGLLREAAHLDEQGLAARTAYLRPGDDAARIIEDLWSRLLC